MRTAFYSLLLAASVSFGQTSVNFSAGPGQPDIRDITGAPVTQGYVALTTPDGLEYGRTNIREVFGLPGRFAGTASSLDPVFDGQPIWLVIESPQGDGIFTSAAWVFPAQGSLPPLNTLSIYSSDVDQARKGTFNANHLIVFPIPEPQLMWMAFTVLFIAIFLKLYESNHD